MIASTDDFRAAERRRSPRCLFDHAGDESCAEVIFVWRYCGRKRDGVLPGRPWVYALAAAGVAQRLGLVAAEMRVGMALTGVRSVAAIDGSVLA